MGHAEGAQIPSAAAALEWGEMQKCTCAVHWVHAREPQVVKTHPKSPTKACFIIISSFRHVKPQIFMNFSYEFT